MISAITKKHEHHAYIFANNTSSSSPNAQSLASSCLSNTRSAWPMSAEETFWSVPSPHVIDTTAIARSAALALGTTASILFRRRWPTGGRPLRQSASLLYQTNLALSHAALLAAAMDVLSILRPSCVAATVKKRFFSVEGVPFTIVRRLATTRKRLDRALMYETASANASFLAASTLSAPAAEDDDLEEVREIALLPLWECCAD
mmetsp:Transcript_94635/g.267148  ORF Transcript_94635/g.267148 Transcript_94635/m.267148 type:complete len:204 (+) Transcript_94635:138-749(+)